MHAPPRPLRLLVLGASGSCGRHLTLLAASRGYRVTALVRPSARFDSTPNIRLLRADPLDASSLAIALPDHDAVASCIGIRRRNPRNPWSPVVSPTDLTARVATLLVDLMPHHSISRLVAISAAGVAESNPQMNAVMRWLVRRSNVGVSYRDLANMERILASSTLDWLAVRPVTLVNGKSTGRVRQINRFNTTARIPRADVAAWMLQTLESTVPFTSRTPMIASAGCGPAPFTTETSA